MEEDERPFLTCTARTTRRRVGVTVSARVCILLKRTEVGHLCRVQGLECARCVARERRWVVGVGWGAWIMGGEKPDEAQCVEDRVT